MWAKRGNNTSVREQVAIIDGCKNNVLILRNRHPDARKASARSHQRASRRRDLVFISKNRTVFMQFPIGARETYLEVGTNAVDPV
jgi:hypothetical protein